MYSKAPVEDSQSIVDQAGAEIIEIVSDSSSSEDEVIGEDREDELKLEAGSKENELERSVRKSIRKQRASLLASQGVKIKLENMQVVVSASEKKTQLGW